MAAAPGSPLTPRPHQQAALNELLHAFAAEHTPRAQILMPCGSGKTLVGRWLATSLHARTTIVFVPTLSLLTQTLRVWRTDTTAPFDALIACSDTTAGRATQAVLDDRLNALPDWASSDVKATTNPGVLTRHITTHNRSRPLVIFSTYHSAAVTARALTDADRHVDLVVCDEAHRLAGQPWEKFRVALDDQALPATARVFMTATPKDAQPVDPALLRDDHDHNWNAKCLSMTDQAMFGPVVYSLDHGTAISSGVLSDYDVHVLAHTDPHHRHRRDPLHTAALTATQTAIRDGATRVLTFHNRVRDAADLAATIDGHTTPDGRHVIGVHLSARDTTAERDRVLGLLADPPPDTAVVLTSARLLGEGIDVPAADTVVFAAPRTSPVDIAQIVGRVMRTSPGKTRGRIVIPVALPDHETADDESALAASQFGHVWNVLSALTDTDSRFHELLTTLPSRRGQDTHVRPGPNLLWDLPDGWDQHSWELRAVDRALNGWDRHYEHVQDWARQHGHARPPLPTVHDNHKIGLWVSQQRSAYLKGTLPVHLTSWLEALPGWAWTTKDATWWNAHDEYILAVKAGWADNPDQLDTIRFHGSPGSLWRWIVKQRHAWRQNTLTQTRIDALTAIPEWDWEPVSEHDGAMIDALIEYVAWKQDANPAADYVHDNIPYRDADVNNLPVGKWVRQVRRASLTGTLDPILRAELDAVIGAHPERPFDWAIRDTQWNLAAAALRQYVDRTGKVAGMPEHHVEVLHPEQHEVNLQYWVRQQRHRYRAGTLDPLRADILSRIPGWVWEIPKAERIKVDVGDRSHGTRRAYAAGCICEECTAANTAENATREARKRAGLPTTLLVDAARARGHVRILAARGAGQKPMARAACVNTKTVIELLDGTLKRIHPETEEAILALTLDKVEQARKPGRHGPRVPAGPTLTRIKQMQELGWPASWIAQEAGYKAGAIQIDPDAVDVSASVEARFKDVYDRLNGRAAPPRQWRKSTPTLAELDAAQSA